MHYFAALEAAIARISYHLHILCRATVGVAGARQSKRYQIPEAVPTFRPVARGAYDLTCVLDDFCLMLGRFAPCSAQDRDDIIGRVERIGQELIPELKRAELELEVKTGVAPAFIEEDAAKRKEKTEQAIQMVKQMIGEEVEKEKEVNAKAEKAGQRKTKAKEDEERKEEKAKEEKRERKETSKQEVAGGKAKEKTEKSKEAEKKKPEVGGSEPGPCSAVHAPAVFQPWCTLPGQCISAGGACRYHVRCISVLLRVRVCLSVWSQWLASHFCHVSARIIMVGCLLLSFTHLGALLYVSSFMRLCRPLSFLTRTLMFVFVLNTECQQFPYTCLLNRADCIVQTISFMVSDMKLLSLEAFDHFPTYVWIAQIVTSLTTSCMEYNERTIVARMKFL